MNYLNIFNVDNKLFKGVIALHIQAHVHLAVRTDRLFAKGDSKNLLLKQLLGHNQLNVFVIWITICYENLKLLTAHMQLH